jgi:hypothetical protein
MMNTYKLIKNPDNNKMQSVLRNGSDSIPFAPDNTDYQTFKKEVLAGAELQDADGNLMTDAKAFVASLP